MMTSVKMTATWDDLDNLEISSSITSKLQIPHLEEQISSLLLNSQEERFESGYRSQLARQIQYVIDHYGEPAISVIANLILNDKVNPDVADEALRWIGAMSNPITHLARRRLLERCLMQANSLYIKDGAGIGLASMDDPDAIPVIMAAIAKEKNLEFKRDLQLIHDQLIQTQMETEL
jgi:hypothetical protein